METPLFFKNDNYNLFGVLHEPDTSPSTLPPQPCPLSTIGIVFCHPFAEEKLILHRVMVNFARALTDKGYYVLRFDYMGHGDSEGNFEEATIETRLSDISQAIQHLKKITGVNKIGLLGVRFGATLAALSAEKSNLINFLILIAPIIKGGHYINQCLRSNLTTQMAVYRKINKTREQLKENLMQGEMVIIEGYLLTKELYSQFIAIDLLKEVINYSNKVLIIQISKNENEPINKSLQELHSTYNQRNNNSSIYNVKEYSFWTESKIYNPEAKYLYKMVFKYLENTS